MSKVGIHVNNKLFTIACDDGQEARVKQLGAYIDERFRELNQAGAAPNESYMLVLTALVIADDMFEAKESLNRAQSSAAPAAPQGPSAQEIEGHIRQQYDIKLRELESALQNTRAQLSQAHDQLAQSVPSLEAVDADAIRAEAIAEAQESTRAKEQDIARAVDALTDRLEGMVKRLKRA